MVRCIRWQMVEPVVVSREVDGRTITEGSGVPLLEVKGLRAVHRSRQGDVIAASDISFSVQSGEAVALVGESGSGKTTIGRCISGLHVPDAGRILLRGIELAPEAGQRPRDIRRQIQIVFQNPYDSLNPRRRVIDEVARPAQILRNLSRKDAEAEAISLLDQVQLPTKIARSFPPELSGGERQRVAIARALAAHPSVMICDEVTSALDVSVQATVLELLAQLQRDLGLALVFISHDLGVVANVATQALVLESGIVKEQGLLRDVLANPVDDYTRRLIDAAPSLAPAGSPEQRQ